MPAQNISRYSALDDSFEGSVNVAIQAMLLTTFWERYRKRAADYRRAAIALEAAQVGSPCSSGEPACTGQPEAKDGPSEDLKLNRYDGSMVFIDATGVFRFRICVDYSVEQVDQTSPEEVAHLEELVREVHGASSLSSRSRS